MVVGILLLLCACRSLSTHERPPNDDEFNWIGRHFAKHGSLDILGIGRHLLLLVLRTSGILERLFVHGNDLPSTQS
jgi:hypothetical protein